MNIRALTKPITFVQNRIIASAPNLFRALGFALALLFMVARPGFWSGTIFLLFALISYFRPKNNSKSALWLFIILLGIARPAIEVFSSLQPSYQEAGEPVTSIMLAMSGLFGVLFYILLGVKQRIFVGREQWHYFAYLMVAFVMSLMVFVGSATILNYFALFLGLYLITQEFFITNNDESEDQIWRIRVIAATVTLATLELVFAISLLPFSATQSAVAVVVMLFLAAEMIFRYLKSELSGSKIRHYLMVLVFFGLIASLVATWQL